jgi:hypothetical protein
MTSYHRYGNRDRIAIFPGLRRPDILALASSDGYDYLVVSSDQQGFF